MSNDRYLRTEGAVLRYRDEGTGPAVVLIHGWALDLQMWDPQSDALRQQLRLIRFDRRGYGLSSGSPGLDHDVTDTLALCRHLRVQPLGCVGMSQGARVVLRLARCEPAFMERFVLDGPPELLTAAAPASSNLDYAGLRNLARSAGLEAFRREWSRHPLMTLETGEPARQQLLQQMIARYPGTDLLADSGPHSAGTPDGFDVPSITQRALVLNGALDTAARLRAGEWLARTLPHCERQIVPASRHLANLDNPAAYNSLLLRFFLPTSRRHRSLI